MDAMTAWSGGRWLCGTVVSCCPLCSDQMPVNNKFYTQDMEGTPPVSKASTFSMYRGGWYPVAILAQIRTGEQGLWISKGNGLDNMKKALRRFLKRLRKQFLPIVLINLNKKPESDSFTRGWFD